MAYQLPSVKLENIRKYLKQQRALGRPESVLTQEAKALGTDYWGAVEHEKRVSEQIGLQRKAVALGEKGLALDRKRTHLAKRGMKWEKDAATVKGAVQLGLLGHYASTGFEPGPPQTYLLGNFIDNLFMKYF